MLNDILNIARGVHGLYNSSDPNYYRNMGMNQYGGMGGYGGYNPYGHLSAPQSNNSTVGKYLHGIGNVLATAAPIVHQMRNYNRGNAQTRMPFQMQRVMPQTRMPQHHRAPAQNHYNPPHYSFNNPSPRVREQQQRELTHWNNVRDQRRENEYWNSLDNSTVGGRHGFSNLNDLTSAPVGRQYGFSNLNDLLSPQSGGEDYQGFARGGPAKQYYVREKMPGYDIGRALPHLLANYWNPRLDPAGVAGNVMGAEAARYGANRGINRLMGTDGYRWSDPRELTTAERLKRFFTHRIPKTINRTFGTHLGTDHNRYWNAAKGLPPAIRNNPGLLEQGAGALRNKAADIGSRVHSGVQKLGENIYDNIIPPVENAYNSLPAIREPMEHAINRSASYLSPFARSGAGNWDLDPNFREEPREESPSILSRMYNSLPDLGINNYFRRKEPIAGKAAEHIAKGMMLEYPEEHERKYGKSSHNLDDMEFEDVDGDRFYDAPEDMFYDAKDFYASGGYTGNIAPDEFVHRRHHRVNPPSDLDEMIRAYIQHMMEQEQRGE